MDANIDEWFISSIKRYDKLHMFSVCSTVYEQELKNENELYVVFKEKDQSQVTFVTLPAKLIQPGDKKSQLSTPLLEFNVHFLVTSPLIQIKSIYKKSKFIISEQNGVSLYSCDLCESDNEECIVKKADILCNISEAQITVDASRNYLALSGKSNEKRLIVDYECLKPTVEIDECYSQHGCLMPSFISQNLLTFGNTSTGCIELHDFRTNEKPSFISTDGADFRHGHLYEPEWNFYTTYEDELNYNLCTTNANIYVFSNEGHFRLFDIRNFNQSLCSKKYPIFCASNKQHVKIKANPLNFNQFSISGIDANVYIFDINNDKVEAEFKHDGHLYDDNCCYKENITTTSFTWLSHVSDKTIISSATNSSTQYWQFIL